MTTFKVRWEIDIDADTPREAAYQARLIQLRPDSIADVFECYATSGAGVSELVDLSEPGPVPAYFHDSIDTLRQAKLFLTHLRNDGKLFHLEDSPDQLMSNRTGKRTFTDEECELLKLRVNEVYDMFRRRDIAYGGDPLGFVMAELLGIDAGDET